MDPHDTTARDDAREIDDLVAAFFRLFSNRHGVTPDLRAIFDLCIPQAIISRCVTTAPEVSSLEDFIAPRQRLLTDGTLTDFEEVETAHRTQVFGHIAQRSSLYTKRGVLNATRFETRGVKVFQFVKGTEGWRISAVAWDDERAGFSADGGLLDEIV